MRIRQLSESDCLLACYLSLVSDFGIKEDYITFRNKIKISPKGLSFIELEQIASHHKIRVKAKKIESNITNNHIFLEKKIALLDNRHFVIIEKVGDTKIKFFDPEKGFVISSLKEFQDVFTNYYISLDKEEDFKKNDNRISMFSRMKMIFQASYKNYMLFMVVTFISQLSIFTLPIAINLIFKERTLNNNAIVALFIATTFILVIDLIKRKTVLALNNSIDDNLIPSYIEALIQKKVEYFKANSIGIIVEKQQSLTYIKNSLFFNIIPSIFSLIIIGGIVGYIYIKSKLLFILILIYILAFFFIFMGIYNKISNQFLKYISLRLKLSDNLSNYILDIEYIKGKKLNEYVEKRLEINFRGESVENISLANNQNTQSIFQMVFSNICIIIIILSYINLSVVDINELLFFATTFTFLNILSSSMNSVKNTFIEYGRIKHYINLIADTMFKNEEYIMNSTNKNHMKKNQLITISDAILRNYEGEILIKNIYFEVFKEKKVLISGPSGIGKTMFLRNIIGLDNQFYHSMQYCYTNEDTGLLLQGGAMDSHNIIQSFYDINIDLFYTQEVFELIRIMQIQNIIYDKNNKLKNSFQLKNIRLSGGEMQRVLLLRSIISKPKIVFWDEPTSALNTELTKKIMDYIFYVFLPKSTYIMITHDQYIKEQMDIIYEIDNKKKELKKL